MIKNKSILIMGGLILILGFFLLIRPTLQKTAFNLSEHSDDYIENTSVPSEVLSKYLEFKQNLDNYGAVELILCKNQKNQDDIFYLVRHSKAFSVVRVYYDLNGENLGETKWNDITPETPARPRNESLYECKTLREARKVKVDKNPKSWFLPFY